MFCNNCGSQNTDGESFCRNCGAALTQAQPNYQQPGNQQGQPYYQQPNYQPQPTYPTFQQQQQPVQNPDMPSPGKYVVFVVFGFIFGIIWGILALVFLNKMKDAIAANNVAEAQACAKKVKMFFFIGLGVNILLILFYIIFVVAIVGAAGSSISSSLSSYY